MSGSSSGRSVPEGLFAERIGVIGTEEAFSLGALIAEVESGGERVIKANLGQPDFPLPGHIADAVAAAIRTGMTTYCDPQGLPELRSAIATSVGRDRGLDIDPERVVVFPGGRPPIGLAQHAYIEPGDEVLYPTPCYPLFESFIDYVGGAPVAMPLREEAGFSLSGADLEAHVTPKTKLVFLINMRIGCGADLDPENQTGLLELPLQPHRGSGQRRPIAGDRRGHQGEGPSRGAHLQRRGVRGHRLRR